MKRKMKCAGLILSYILFVFLIGETVQAGEEGSICIRLEDGGEGTSREGVVFAYTKVADIINGDFVGGGYLEGLELDESSTAQELLQAAETIAKRVDKPDGIAVTDERGVGVIDRLETGVYLLTVAEQKKYDKVAPILLTVPSLNEKSGVMEYEVEVVPKHEPVQEDRPVAPQTNLNGSYRQKIISAGMCVLGMILLFAFVRRKGNDEMDF